MLEDLRLTGTNSSSLAPEGSPVTIIRLSPTSNSTFEGAAQAVVLTDTSLAALSGAKLQQVWVGVWVCERGCVGVRAHVHTRTRLAHAHSCKQAPQAAGVAPLYGAVEQGRCQVLWPFAHVHAIVGVYGHCFWLGTCTCMRSLLCISSRPARALQEPAPSYACMAGVPMQVGQLVQSANRSVVLLLSPNTKKLALQAVVGSSVRCSSVDANASNTQVGGPP